MVEVHRSPERGDNAENGSGDGNRDEGLVEALRDVLAGESKTVGDAADWRV